MVDVCDIFNFSRTPSDSVGAKLDIQSYDIDGSGKITALELSDWMKKHGRVMNPDGIKLMIDAFDENDDGQIGKD